jgi:histidinol-phosphatase (PHP family)
MWSNFHTHSTYCDGKSSLAECVAKARSENMISLGFSSHAPVPFECKWCMKQENFGAYLNELDSLKAQSGNLEIYKGLEVDYIPGVLSPGTFRNDLDYTIGSIHFVDQFHDGRKWEIDGTHVGFLEGLEQIFKNDAEKAITRYYSLTREMITTSRPDVVGHLDKIKIQNHDNKLFKETDFWYRDEIKNTIDAIANAGCILEVNTRGIYQKKTTTTYPSPWILELALEKNVRITLSSDAHHPDDLTNQFEETATWLLAMGFKKLSMLKNGSWKAFDFTPYGIITD